MVSTPFSNPHLDERTRSSATETDNHVSHDALPSDVSFQTLFERAGVGMIEIDTDWRILRANAVYCEIAGRSEDELLGGSCLAFTAPEDREKSEAALGGIVGDGPDSVSFEKRYLRDDGRTVWIRSNLTRIEQPDGSNRFLKIVEDISDHKAAEARRSAFLELNDRFRDVEDPADLAYSAAEILGRTLNVSRAGYGTIDPVAETITIERDWNAPGIKSLAGVLNFREYGSYIEDLKRGETVIFADADKDPRTAATADALKAISAQSVVNMPITEQGGLVALLYLNHATARPWSNEEIQFIRDVAERTRTVVERRRVEKELRESEERFRTVYENAGVGMIEIDADWRILGANDAYAEIIGLPRAELIGQNCLAFTHPDDIELSKEVLRRAAEERQGDRISFEKRYVRPDGRIVWIRSNLAKISDGAQAVRFLKIVEDITQAKLAQEALREEGHNLETLNRTGAAVAGELDLERVVQMVTDAGVELTGAQFGAFFYNVVDQQGESYTLYTLSGAPRSAFEKFPMPRNTHVFGPTFNGEGVVRSDDITKDARYGKNPPYYGKPKGHLPVVSYLAVPVTSRSGEVIGGLFFGHPESGRFTERHERLMVGIAAQAAIAIDNAQLFRRAQQEIEQRVNAEEALTALNETLESRVVEEIARRSTAEDALRQAQKMETVGQLSGGIAHDFNNLLQIIHGNLSLLQQGISAEEDKWERAIRNALTGTERAAALTRRLLAFSRRQPLDPRPVDINRLVADMSDLLRRTLGEIVTIELDIGTAAAVAEVDPNQLENSILNLAINARDAMPEGGVLRISAAMANIGADFLAKHPDAIEGEYVRLTVADTGEGMDLETLARAIEPFFTTKEVGRGTGLGLSMVYGFIRQSGGYLDLRSELGLGTTVDLYLPPARSPVSEEAEPPRAELVRGNGETILLCEDDEGVRQFSAEGLVELGYRVLEASDAASALELLRNSIPVDLLFTDVVLPGGMTGADLAREARLLQPGLRVLFTTGYARSALDDAAFGETATVLSKPFSIAELALRVAKVLDGVIDKDTRAELAP
jgi:PAS domain S-box-containing protein